ncbi:tRNA (guanine-N1)-methyltransferase [Ligilactobacillus ruminis]|uniref:tRNA (guanine-N1)-methyltransferase n=1 Tax=Ligilactobacillus ruminis TaxID=1623 RepID=UPI003B9AC59F
MKNLFGIRKEREHLLDCLTVEDITSQGDWSLEQSLDTAYNRAKLMDSLERLDRRSLYLFEAALKGGE